MSDNQDLVDDVVEKFRSKSAVIGIVGLGYVGQPLTLRFAEVGCKVIGFDISTDLVDKLNSGQSPIQHVDDARIRNALADGFEATSDFSRIAEVDGIVVCVPTPLNKHREPDLSFVVIHVSRLPRSARGASCSS